MILKKTHLRMRNKNLLVAQLDDYRCHLKRHRRKPKRRRVAELTTDRSANELQFAVNVVSGSNHSEVSPQIFSFSTAEALALMVDLDISADQVFI
ncbi:unnamed protein product [Acanthoscelides obtectus]|uniref:Uncharacterized protein n=1 Tax=Acanthoscelides obtectus TaxID=200917 RepID=A0A9P0LL32_ACAOB|nr:unnamed protein product [Acanthoscelides obtectus]CAK1653257.1 hypothetical protein AOBTE_LOCUS18162 [Acanthoscelides obtectus]